MEAQEAHEFREKAEEASRESFGRRVAVLVGVLAALLSIATLLANQAAESIVLSQEQQTDAYNEYQADKLKLRLDQTTMGMLKALRGGADAAAVDSQTASLQKDADHQNAKLPGLLEKAKGLGDEREKQERKHRAFQLSEAALQIGIVLASIAIVARLAMLAYVAGVLGVAGVLLLLDGVLLFFKLP